MAQQQEWPEATYILRQAAFMPTKPGGRCQWLQAGASVTYQGKPGPHMEATCEEGREALKRAGEQTLSPLNRLALHGTSDDDLLEAMRNNQAFGEFLRLRAEREIPQVKLPGAASPVAVPKPPAAPPVAAAGKGVPPPPPPPAPKG